MTLTSFCNALTYSRFVHLKRYLVRPRQPRWEALEDRRLLSVVPNDPRFLDQWPLDNAGQTGGTWGADIDAPAVWSISTGDPANVVAVLDTGIDYTHEDLYLNIWINQGEIPAALRSKLVDVDSNSIITFHDLNHSSNASHVLDNNDNGYIDGGDLLLDRFWEDRRDTDGNGYVDDLIGWDWVNDDNNPMDNNWHGTKVAGFLGAIGNNGVGIAGVNWNVQMMPLRFKLDNPTWTASDAVEAIDYAVAMGAPISNNSWGNDTGVFIQEIYDAIDRARLAGHLFVTGAGNQSRDTDVLPRYPADYDLDNIISVAATSDDDLLANFSDWGAVNVDLAAPGRNVLTTDLRNSYSWGSGTSYATPHVAGVAGLLKSQHPEWQAAQLKQRILETVDPLPALSGITVTGGRLNAARAVAGTTITVDEPAVLEGDSGTAHLNFTVRRAGDTTENVNLVWTTADDTATSGDDYVAASGQITFDDPSVSELTITVDLLGDMVGESHERLLLNLGVTSGRAVLLDDTVRGTVLNDDVSISVDDVTVTEGVSEMVRIDSILTADRIEIPMGMAFDDTTELLYVVGAEDSNLLRYDVKTGEVVELVAPNSHGLSYPRDVAIGPDNRLYVASSLNDSVLRFNLDGSYYDEFVETGSAGLDRPAGLAFDSDGNLYVTSFDTDEILIYDAWGAPLGDGVFVSAANNGGMDKPTDITFDENGILYATDRATNSVLRFAADGSSLGPFGETGTSGLNLPIGLQFSPHDGDLYVAEFADDKIIRFDGSTGAFVEVVVDASQGAPDAPVALVFDNEGRMYSGSFYSDEVIRYGSGSTANFMVSLSGPSTETINVDYNTLDGLALAGDDYESVTGTLTFTPGRTTQPISVLTIDDATIESDETFALILTNPSADAQIADDRGEGKILDDERHPILVTPTSGLVTTEYGETAEFDVVLSRQPNAEVTIDLLSNLPSEALISTGVMGNPAANLSLTFTPQDWDLPQTVTVTGIDDGKDDGDITYTIVLSAAVSLDPSYNGIDPEDVSATNFEFESLEIQVEAFIDGRDQLILQSNTVQWHHLDFAVVRGLPTVISTTLNGHVLLDRFEWHPEWPDASSPTDQLRFESYSTLEEVLFPAIPNTVVSVALAPLESRDSTHIVQRPSSANGHELILEFDDTGPVGAAWYKALLTITPVRQGNRVPGDSNDDGIFNSSDLVAVFLAGEYEDGLSQNSTFDEGDWNGDGEFDSKDFVFVFQAGTYVAAAMPIVKTADLAPSEPLKRRQFKNLLPIIAEAIFGDENFDAHLYTW